MHHHQRGSALASILGIVVCGGLGGVAAWAVVTTMGWSGAFGAIVAAIIGMVVATALWTAGTSLFRTVRRRR
jgi:fructose-specific phosphotransferase system IIC component